MKALPLKAIFVSPHASVASLTSRSKRFRMPLAVFKKKTPMHAHDLMEHKKPHLELKKERGSIHSLRGGSGTMARTYRHSRSCTFLCHPAQPSAENKGISALLDMSNFLKVLRLMQYPRLALPLFAFSSCAVKSLQLGPSGLPAARRRQRAWCWCPTKPCVPRELVLGLKPGSFHGPKRTLIQGVLSESHNCISISVLIKHTGVSLHAAQPCQVHTTKGPTRIWKWFLPSCTEVVIPHWPALHRRKQFFDRWLHVHMHLTWKRTISQGLGNHCSIAICCSFSNKPTAMIHRALDAQDVAELGSEAILFVTCGG